MYFSPYHWQIITAHCTHNENWEVAELDWLECVQYLHTKGCFHVSRSQTKVKYLMRWYFSEIRQNQQIPD